MKESEITEPGFYTHGPNYRFVDFFGSDSFFNSWSGFDLHDPTRSNGFIFKTRRSCYLEWCLMGGVELDV